MWLDIKQMLAKVKVDTELDQQHFSESYLEVHIEDILVALALMLWTWRLTRDATEL